MFNFKGKRITANSFQNVFVCHDIELHMSLLPGGEGGQLDAPKLLPRSEGRMRGQQYSGSRTLPPHPGPIPRERGFIDAIDEDLGFRLKLVENYFIRVTAAPDFRSPDRKTSTAAAIPVCIQPEILA